MGRARGFQFSRSGGRALVPVEMPAQEMDTSTREPVVIEGTAREIDLESGIAEVFATLRARADGEDRGDIDPAAMPIDSGITFQLLDELDRLWTRSDA